jgi:hypothetical protein
MRRPDRSTVTRWFGWNMDRGLGRALERAGRRDEALGAYRKGLEVATRTGDLQTKKEIEVFLHRLESAGG